MSRAYASPKKEEIQAQRLELSLNPEDGSLLTAPLTQVLLATTDGLYQDLWQMAHAEVDVDATAADAEEDSRTRKSALSDLSFPQRRHEIAWRLAQHGRGLQHVAALTAAAASSDLSEQVRVSSTALQHSRTAWVQADEAQDALYFFHAQLFPVRAAPHDIYGASDVQLMGRWLDLPTDLRLAADPYETSRPAEWTKSQVQEEWQLAIREKLLTGEVGWMREQQITPPWKVAIRGSRVHLTFGRPRQIQNAETRSEHVAKDGTETKTSTAKETYPVSAWLTVLPIAEAETGENDEDDSTEWSLLSLDVTVQAKTGEFNHQLETSNRQRYDLHRLAALAMTKEEQRARKQAEEEESADPARPLDALFRMSRIFLLSWQLELLSAQAQALRRGIWAAGDGNSLEVTPVRFMDQQTHPEGVLGVLSISFWRVDDSYGPPTMCDLIGEEGTHGQINNNDQEKSSSSELREYITTTNQLVLCIRADTERGIRVAVSGASALQASDAPEHSKRVARDLLEAASNPLALSASDALLAATRLCGEQKCQATVAALRRDLPSWAELRLERCGIVVAADLQYHGIERQTNGDKNRPVLFRIGFDARTGSFVALFSRNTHLLLRLAGNDLQASEAMAVRIAKLPANRRRAARSESSGRIVRDAFESLIRSMNNLGQRVGVGGQWDDVDEMSPSLRERNVGLASRDVRQALISACGIAALYGIAPMAIGGAFGLNAMLDAAGGPLSEKVEGINLISAPPVAILLDQKPRESASTSIDGGSKKKRYLKQKMFALSCLATETGVKLVPLMIQVDLESPVSPVERKQVSIIQFREPAKGEETFVPPPKRLRTYSSEEDDRNTLKEVDIFAEIMAATHSSLPEPDS